RILGDACPVEVDILRDGHDVLAGRIVFRAPAGGIWHSAPLAYDYASDRWRGAFHPDRLGRWTYSVEAWTDRFATWRHAVASRLEAGREIRADLLDGAALVAEAAAHATGESAATLARIAASVGCDDLSPRE